MNKFFKVASIITSGLVVGAIAGKFAFQGISKSKKSTVKNSVKDYLNKENDEIENYFV